MLLPLRGHVIHTMVASKAFEVKKGMDESAFWPLASDCVVVSFISSLFSAKNTEQKEPDDQTGFQQGS